MAPGKDNLSESVSVLTQRQLDKFACDYRIPTDLHPVLPAKDKTIYPFLPRKFPLYTRICNFANYRVPFTRFLMKVLQFFRVHLCQVNPFGLSRVNHFEISFRALNRKPDLNVFRYFYKFITAGGWYTFAHRKGIPSPSGDEKFSLKNWKDNFFWLDDLCLPAGMAWRFKDQTMNFELGENFAFNQQLAKDLIDNRSLIRPLPEHLLLLGQICHVWGRWNRDCLVIHRSGKNVVSLRDALKVPNFNELDFQIDELAEDEEPFLKQTSSSAQEICPLADPKSSEAPATETTSVGPRSNEETTGSSGARVRAELLSVDTDSDPKVRDLDQALLYRPSGVAAKGKGVSLDSGRKALSAIKKAKKTASYSGNNILTDLTEHLSGGKSSREEASKARSDPSATFSGGYLPVDETKVMEAEEPAVTSMDEGKVQGDVKMV
ncbi:hypothetical protein Hanom_Chr05g00424891 [Helianthus anomalus]